MSKYYRHASKLSLILIFVCGCAMATPEPPMPQPVDDLRYAVVSLVPPNDDFNQAGAILLKRHNALEIRADSNALEELLPELRKQRPNYVAFVIKPEDLDFNLVQQVLKLSTEIDDDPFVDFSYGFITGRDAQAAVKLVKASASPIHQQAAITQFGVAAMQLPKSTEQRAAWPLRKGTVPMTAFLSRGDSDEERDEKFIAASMPKLENSPILLFASHGLPDGLVGGPKASDIKGRNLGGSVALNIACYTGVTETWFEDDWKTGKVRQRSVDSEDSFCLQMIDSGVASYFAYTCPRPAGPNMMGHSMLIASGGETVGEMQRQNANSVVLAHLLKGSETVITKKVTDGDLLARDRTSGDTVLAMSTGGVLIGDPAFRPFAKRKNGDPRTQTVTTHDERIVVDLKIGTPIFHFYSSEQINYWNDQKPAMRIEGDIALDDRIVTAIKLVESSIGDVPHHLIAAVETHQGKRRLRFKALFAQPEMKRLQQLTTKGLSGRFEITTGPLGGDSNPKIIRHSTTAE